MTPTKIFIIEKRCLRV